jgi:hypothetical protein
VVSGVRSLVHHRAWSGPQFAATRAPRGSEPNCALGGSRQCCAWRDPYRASPRGGSRQGAKCLTGNTPRTHLSGSAPPLFSPSCCRVLTAAAAVRARLAQPSPAYPAASACSHLRPPRAWCVRRARVRRRMVVTMVWRFFCLSARRHKHTHAVVLSRCELSPTQNPMCACDLAMSAARRSFASSRGQSWKPICHVDHLSP